MRRSNNQNMSTPPIKLWEVLESSKYPGLWNISATLSTWSLLLQKAVFPWKDISFIIEKITTFPPANPPLGLG